MKRYENWYKGTPIVLKLIAGNEWQKLAAFIAATSPQTRVRKNCEYALREWRKYKKGKRLKGWIPCHTSNLNRAAQGEALSGPKVSAFARALCGDTRAVVIDSWMLRYYGEKESVSLSTYAAIANRMTFDAYKAGLNPAEYQALIWCQTKQGVEGTRDSIEPFARTLWTVAKEMGIAA